MADSALPVPASYPITDTSTLAIEYAKAKIRPYVDAASTPDGVNHGGWQDVGEVEYFKQNVNVTPKEVWSKSQSVAQLILTVNTKLKASVSFKALNRSKLIRAYSMLGSVVPVNQPGGAGSYGPVTAVPGEVHYVGAYNISGVAGAPAGSFTVVDMAAGAIMFNSNMDPAVAGTQVTFTYTCPARTSYEIVAGGAPTIDVEMILRGVSDVGRKGMLHVLRLRLNPKGDQDYISSNDDISGFEFEGNALLVSRNGVNAAATWTPLDA